MERPTNVSEGDRPDERRRSRHSTDSARTIFLLSPATCNGRRADLLLREAATFPLARALRAPGGSALGKTFSFLSGLYFRGKLAYGSAFAYPPPGVPGVMIITPGQGLLPAEARISLETLREIARVPVEPGDDRYRRPLARDAASVAEKLPALARVVLLGSIATTKYVEPLCEALGRPLLYPQAFRGRGSLSRGALLLRATERGRELRYAAVEDPGASPAVI